MPNKTRFEREIDEILEKSEGTEKPRSPRKKQFEPFSPSVPRRKSPVRPGAVKFNPGRVIIVGLVILAIAAFSPFGKLPFAIAGTLLVVIGYVAWFRMGGRFSGRTSQRGTTDRPAGGPGNDEPRVKYWRGRRIEEKPDRQSHENPDDRGKIIEFKPPDDDPDQEDPGRDDK